MLGILYFLVFVFAGILISNRIFYEQPLYIRIWAGSLTGVLLNMWLVVPFSFFAGFTVLSHIFALLLLIAIYALAFFKYKTDSFFKINADENEKAFLITVIPIFALIAYLLWTHVIEPGAGGALYGGQSTFGDLSLHLGIITSIPTQGVFPPEYSIFPGQLLSYPFLTDSLSSSMYLLGTGLRLAVLLPSLVIVIMLVSGFFILANEIIRCKWAAVFASVLFFFNGGFGFIYFMDGLLKSPANLTKIFTEFYHTPTNFNEHFIRWSNTICDMIIPQRAAMAGWAFAILGFWLLYRAINENKRNYFLFAGIVAGLLPMIHTHSFLAFGIIAAVWCLVNAIDAGYRNESMTKILKISSILLLIIVATIPGFRLFDSKYLSLSWIALGLTLLIILVIIIKYIIDSDKKQLLRYMTSWAVFLIPVVVLALPQLMIWTFPQSSGGNFLKLQWGWSANEGDIWPWFWVKNVGVVMLLLIPATLASSRKFANLCYASTVLFVISNLVQFQPNAYDNNKLLYIWYIFAAITVSAYFFTMLKRMKGVDGRAALICIAVFLCVFSAALTIGREIKSSGMMFYSADDVSAAEFIKAGTFNDSLFITGGQHLNPVAALAGRKIYLGSTIYVFFHGLKYSDRAAEIKTMYQNSSEFKALADKLNVDYVYFSDYERSQFNVGPEYFEQNYPVVFKKGNILIFAISNRAIQKAASP